MSLNQRYRRLRYLARKRYTPDEGKLNTLLAYFSARQWRESQRAWSKGHAKATADVFASGRQPPVTYMPDKNGRPVMVWYNRVARGGKCL